MNTRKKLLTALALSFLSNLVFADPVCNKGMLNALYGFQATGHANPNNTGKKELIADGTFRFNGTGTISNVTMVIRSSTYGQSVIQPVTYTGTYAVQAAACTGSITLTKQGATNLVEPVTLSIVPIDGGNAFFFRLSLANELWGGTASKI
jgi:hypothetical protein